MINAMFSTERAYLRKEQPDAEPTELDQIQSRGAGAVPEQEPAHGAIRGNSKVRLIADILIVAGLALLAWVLGFVVFAFLAGGPEGPNIQTMLLVATIPAVPVAMVTVAVLIYRRHPRGLSN